MQTGFLLAFLLSLTELLSEFVSERIKAFHGQLISFNAGVMLCFLFLLVFPEIFNTNTNGLVFVFLLCGFVAFNLAEKFVYRHGHAEKTIQRELALVHLSGFYITGLIEGMALFFFKTLLSGPAGLFLFVPLFLNSVNASVYMGQIIKTTGKKGLALVSATGPILGFLLASTITDSQIVHYLFALVSGALLYVVTRDSLPTEKKENPQLLLCGILLGLLALQFAGLLF